MSTTHHTNEERISSFDEFSPRRILHFGGRLALYLRSKLVWILAFAIILGLIGAAFAYYKKPTYIAEVSFAVDEERSQHNRSEFSEFSEQLGLDPIDGGNVFSSINNIQELLKSRLLIEKTLRSSAMVNGNKLLFADFFLDSLDYRDKWVKKSAYPNIKFNALKKDSNEVWFENGLLTNMYKTITGKYLKVSGKGKATTITAVVCETEHPLFSKYFVEALLAEVAGYYVQSKTERSRNNLDIIEKRTDSVRRAFIQSLYGRAGIADADINLVRESFSVPGEKKQTDVQILRTTYIDLSRKLESARTSLMNNTPTIQLLDRPVLPLDRVKPSVVKQFIMMFLIGAVLAMGFFVAKLFLKSLTR
ncbi:MAG: hypothetical protein H7Y31_08310 [Chitinophagaceae bacterium]|nr:hypothetical protein [Chitinophagaceae bacterium]